MPRVRVACARCGPRLERLSWLEPYARLTRRLGESVAQLCRVASIRHVASFFGLDWKTVKDLDLASLQHQLGPVDLDGLEVIGMDEFAIQKGHRYATVIVEPMRKRGCCGSVAAEAVRTCGHSSSCSAPSAASGCALPSWT